MVKSILFVMRQVFFCCLVLLPTYAAQNPIDSLKAVVKNAAEDTNKVNALNNLGWEIVLTTGDYVMTKQCTEQAIALSDKLDYKKGKADALNLLGAANMFQGNYTEALKNYEAALEIKEEMNDIAGMAAAYSNIGLVYMYTGDYPEALKNHQASLKMEKERNDKAGIAGSYTNIGIVYEDIGNYPLALENHLASLKIYEEMGDKYYIAICYTNIGNILEIQGNFKDALKNHEDALEIRKQVGDQRGIADSYSSIGKCLKEMGKYQEALDNNMAALKIAMEIDNKSGIGGIYNNIGSIYDAQGDSAKNKGNVNYAFNKMYPLALENFHSALKVRTEIGDKAGVAATYVNIGQTSIKLKKYNDARTYLDDGLVVAKELGNKKIIRDSYFSLSALDSAQGNFAKAYEHYKLYIVYRDSLFNEEKVQQTVQMQMQYEIERDAILEMQKTEKERLRIKRRNTLQYLGIFSIVFVLVVIVMLLGKIKVPVGVSRGLNFVSLLILFESVLVFTDPYLDVFTGGVPVYKLLMNIVLAILIFPIHNFVDKRFRKRLNLA